MVGPISLTLAHLPFFFHICHLPWKVNTPFCSESQACHLQGWMVDSHFLPILESTTESSQCFAAAPCLLPLHSHNLNRKIFIVNFPEWYSWKFSSSLPGQFWSDGAESEQTTYLGDGQQIVSPNFLLSNSDFSFFNFNLNSSRSYPFFFMLICIFWCVRPKNGGRRASVAVSLVTTDHPPLADSAEDRVISLTTLYLIKKFYSWNLTSTEHKGKGRSYLNQPSILYRFIEMFGYREKNFFSG